MQIEIISIGNKMPSWVNEGYQEYAKRMPRDYQLQLNEIPLPRQANPADLARSMRKGSEAMLSSIPSKAHVIALDVTGKQHDTHSLSKRLAFWHDHHNKVALLIGGPDGLSESCLQRANEKWSLSPLTFPHPLVRVIVAEQLYRAWTLLQNHPYHRN